MGRELPESYDISTCLVAWPIAEMCGVCTAVTVDFVATQLPVGCSGYSQYPLLARREICRSILALANGPSTGVKWTIQNGKWSQTRASAKWERFGILMRVTCLGECMRALAQVYQSLAVELCLCRNDQVQSPSHECDHRRTSLRTAS